MTPSPSPPVADELPCTMAHRGLSAHAPENTLSAVRAAHETGARWIELDVQLLGDGTPVIWHDGDVKRCSNGRGRLRDLSLASAKTLDVGSWFEAKFTGERMATLDEMLELVNELGLGLNLELKVNRGRDARALVEAVLPRVMEAVPAKRLILSSFDAVALGVMRTRQPDPERLRLGILYQRPPRNWADDAARLEAYSLHVDWRRLSARTAQAMAASPYSLLCYTVNDPRVFERLRAWGVASAISDDPGRLLRQSRIAG
ncbi:glycerophosphoryl diester phosphodiesterase [Modicisalibacter ilicicola DSM 19980]|uniref:Glycerophosphoryl diester phosphodiesterase n=1 Tax=Modicisalibacter ilicicola DSM 19980 TaxID=1121942 RepID=A0A1M4X6W5_9GAMM|nr:glycerophosphodiester phosphodiesterase family protein [Halomonas ilicicola]SHE88832.1 glycerophosphoryl diester phosphodiesterase [Halomonas ilicicola DSM 19980]